MTSSATVWNVLVMHPGSDLTARLTKVLGQNGYAVTVVAEPLHEAHRIWAYEPHLIIASAAYTTTSGEPLAAWLHREVKVPVVALCSSGDTLGGVRMLEVGADDYITPACGSREALARVGRLLRPKTKDGVR